MDGLYQVSVSCRYYGCYKSVIVNKLIWSVCGRYVVGKGGRYVVGNERAVVGKSSRVVGMWSVKVSAWSVCGR